MTEDWKFEGLENGIATYRLTAWAAYYPLIEKTLAVSRASSRDFVWRGQRRDDWALSPSLDRLIGRLTTTGSSLASNPDEILRIHLERFKMAVRGRRGQNPPELPSENDWWALGQHYGLATPLLDWTRSPFAAAYFAFEDDNPDTTEYRVVYGLDRRAVELRNYDLVTAESVEIGRPPLLEFYDPLSNENPRLVAQGGLFTRTPLGTPVEQWITAEFEEAPEPVMYRILIPNRDRAPCLRALNRMNINHLSLFPDLNGASRFVNLALEDSNV